MSQARNRPGPELELSATDDPVVVAAAATEDYTLHATPPSWRMSRWSLASVWWALASAMFWLILGALVALTVGTVDAIIGMVLAALVYSAISWLFVGYAARTGLTANLFSRALFGSRGSVITPLLVAVTAVYFACFEGSVVAVALQAYFGGPVALWYAVVVLYSVPLILGAARVFLDRFNGWLFPLYLLGLVVAVVWAGLEFGLDGSWSDSGPRELTVSGPGWWWAFTTYLADFVLLLAAWDFARFARVGPRDLRFHRVVTFGPVFYFFTIVVNGVIGVFVALTIPTDGSLSETSGVLGIVGLMGFVGLLFVWVSQTRINTMNFYLAVTNLEGFVARLSRFRLPRAGWGVLVGVIVFAVMLSNVFDFILVALRYQAVLTVTWTACALAFLLAGRFGGDADPEWRPGRVARFDPVGVGAWSAGSVVGFALLTFLPVSSWAGTWALPLAFGVSLLVQVAGMWLRGSRQALLRRPHDPRDEVVDAWSVHVRCHVCERFYVAVEMDRDPSAGHRAICAEHAQDSAAYADAVLEEARSTGS